MAHAPYQKHSRKKCHMNVERRTKELDIFLFTYVIQVHSHACLKISFWIASFITSIHEEYYLEHRCLRSFLSNTDYFTLVHHFLHTFILLLCIQQQQKTNPLFYTSRKSLFYFFLFKVVTLEEQQFMTISFHFWKLFIYFTLQ